MHATDLLTQPKSPADSGNVTRSLRGNAVGRQPRSLPPSPNWPDVPGYEILSEIGAGGMGIVYKARQCGLQRTVALKMLRSDAQSDPEYHVRLQVEAESVARLQHPNIIQIFEIGTLEPPDGEGYPSPFMALEFVDGGNLLRYTHWSQPPKFAAEIVEKLARAVHSAHRAGVIHRDLKPENVLVTRAGEPKIADFGVAKQFGSGCDERERCLTQAGCVVGTPDYMAPEQAMGKPPTPAVDVYALGVILYELLTAKLPFEGTTAVEIMNRKQHAPASPRRRRPNLPRDLDTICLKCLEVRPAKRYPSALALADDLHRFLEGRPIHARRVRAVEKAFRWCRRNPSAAISLGSAAAIFLAAFLLVTKSYWRAEIALQHEADRTREALSREAAERWARYRADLVAAASEVGMKNVDGARRLLEDAPVEHRNWEWRHFQSRLDLADRVLENGDAPKISATAITPRGNRAVQYGDDGFVRLWDTDSGECVRTYRGDRKLWRAACSSDGRLMAVVMADHTIELRQVDTDRVLCVLRGHGGTPFSIQFSSGGGRLVTAALDGSVCVWELPSGRLVRTHRPYGKGIGYLGVTRDGRLAVVANIKSEDVRILNLDTGAVAVRLPDLGYALDGTAFSPDGDRLVTSEKYPSNALKLWDARSGKLIGQIGKEVGAFTELAFNADGSRFAAGSTDQTVRLYDGITGRLIATLKAHAGQVRCVAFSPDGGQLASGSDDHTICLWDAGEGKLLGELSGHTDMVFSIAYSADGRRVVSASTDGSIRLWNAAQTSRKGVLRGHTKFVYSAAFLPDGKRIASAGWDGTARIWDVATGQQKGLFDHGKDAIVTSAAVHPDGRLLATRTRGAVFLWDIDSGKQLDRWEAPSDTWRDSRLAFSPSGDLLAYNCSGGTVRLWDVGAKTVRAELRGHTDEIRDLAFSPDGRRLATAGDSEERAVRLWDVASGTQVGILKGHNFGVYSLAFSPDGRWLCSGSTDGTARLWDAATWREVAVLKCGTNVYGLAFTPDSQRLACACADKTVRLWDVATHQSVAELRGHTDYVHAVAFSPDGTRLVSASGDFDLRIWDTVRPQDRMVAPK